MNADDFILISVDDHLVEPPTMFDAHIPEKYRAANMSRNGSSGLASQRSVRHFSNRRATSGS